MEDTTNTPTASCPRCGQAMRFDRVKTAIWQGDRVFLVEDIPAFVCDACVEQFYDDKTTDIIRRLTEDGFPGVKSKCEILVPVFSLQGQFESQTKALATAS